MEWNFFCANPLVTLCHSDKSCQVGPFRFPGVQSRSKPTIDDTDRLTGELRRQTHHTSLCPGTTIIVSFAHFSHPLLLQATSLSVSVFLSVRVPCVAHFFFFFFPRACSLPPAVCLCLHPSLCVLLFAGREGCSPLILQVVVLSLLPPHRNSDLHVLVLSQYFRKVSSGCVGVSLVSRCLGKRV
mgnify:FL=1